MIPCFLLRIVLRLQTVLKHLLTKKQNTMKVGDRVRVIESIMVYHHPQHKSKPFDVKGMEGLIISVIGQPITANLPVVVQFEEKFKAHFRDFELEVI